MPRNTKTGRLRIIAGQWRGRRFSFPNTGAVRPTPDNVRETLFNWLAPTITNAECLDLYAGSGALGLEALSRGAARVDFIESDRNCTRAIDAVLDQFNASENDLGWTTHTATVERFLRATSRQWDIVFLDPPFGSALAWPTVETLVSGNLLKPGARLYVETERNLDLPELDTLTLQREKHHGRSTSRLLTFAVDGNGAA